MLSKNEDAFLQALAEKISRVKPRQAEEGDWVSFNKAYQTHKQGKNARKKGLFLWFSLLTFSLAAMFASFLFKDSAPSLNGLSAQVKIETISNTIEPMPLNVSEKSKETTTHKRTMVLEKQSPTNPLLLNKKVQQNVSPEPIEIGYTEPIAVNKINSEFTLLSHEKLAYTLKTKLNNANFIHQEKLEPLNANSLAKQLSVAGIDTIPRLLSKGKGIPQLRISSVAIGYLLQSNAYQPLNDPTYQNIHGLGASAGFHFSNPWRLQVGMNALYSDQSKREKGIFQTSEMQIDRIDTSIKYNSFYNRLMMQIDTVWSKQTVWKESQTTQHNTMIYYQFPIQISYQIVTEKRRFYAALGLNGALVYRKEMRVNRVGENNVGNESNTTYQWLFAPTIGMGAHQKIYKNWDVTLSVNYIRYLNNGLHKPENIQIQSGLTYNF